MRPTRNDAIAELANGASFEIKTDGTFTILNNPSLVITEEQVVQKLEALQANYDSKDYARSRVQEYPPIGDQLDALFKAGVFPAEMAAAIQAVKDKYPKGGAV